MIVVKKTSPDGGLLNVLIIGGGGREHALAWKTAQSPQVQQVWVAPGNAGTALENKVRNVDIHVDDTDALLEFARQHQIDLTIVGPEAALAAGVVDAFTAAGMACFGPTKTTAQLEISKVFSKQFMAEHHIPTARYAVFKNKMDALHYIENHSLPLVIKADGLAAGKGVIIAESYEQADSAITAMLEDHLFGAAGQQIVIEEFITGSELSFIVMSDGEHILPLASSKDHKRRDDYDQGPNTGGMGAYSPVEQLSDALQEQIIQDIITPIIQAFKQQGTPYIGFLYAGLMITPEGEPKVLEFNCRLGDPETQPILMRLQSDLVELCFAALAGQLDQVHPKWDSRSAVAVVLAANGYPDQYKTGLPILIDLNNSSDSCKIFHAGTQQKNQQIVINGGRVLTATALGEDLKTAAKKAYDLVQLVAWPNCHYRTDIGK